jgi:uncharacterized protein with NAD-binding domain and iron-sulfur cluster
MSTEQSRDTAYPTGSERARARFAVVRTEPASVSAPAARRSAAATPIVTVFGAGITGLSVAHELIERGFRVRVVEAAASDDREYEAEVGGLARNQFGRAALYAAELADRLGADAAPRPATTGDGARGARAHRHLRTWLALVAATPAPGRGAGGGAAAAGHGTAAALGMQPVGQRYPFPERLAFVHADAADADPVAAPDLYGASNDEKLAVIADRLCCAYAASKAEIVRTLRSIGGEAAVARFQPDSNKEHACLVLEVDVAAFTAARRDEGRSYAVTQQLAERVRDDLLAANQAADTPIPLLAAMLTAQGMGEAARSGVASPSYLPAEALWVELHVGERLLPGEHGYRYFPAFYRNLFDVMRRTPILDDDGRVTAQTALSQLVPAPDVGFAFRGGLDAHGRTTEPVLKSFVRRRALSFAELRRQLDLTFADLRVTERDLLFYELELTRYATSCTARRRAYEEVSWWDFLRGRHRAADPAIRDNDPSDPRNAIYSERMAHWLREIPQALIAMQSAETDARTYGTIVTQLLQGDLGSGTTPDSTLNGPTSVVWLRQWKRFLKRQGVDFFVGRLRALELDRHGALVPIVEGPDGDRPRLEPLDPTSALSADEWQARRAPGAVQPFDDSDFFVLAVPIEVAAQLTRDLLARRPVRDLATSGLRGDVARLARLVHSAGIVDPADVKRDFFTGRPTSRHYPLRDFAGVQYFFPRRIGIGDGHVYYADAEWGLSSISQLAYWRDRGGPQGAFLGQISVDVGDWYAPRALANGERLPAYRCGRDQIARATWEQVVECLRKREGHRIPEPAFYSLDQAIDFDAAGRHASNATPFLISLPSQWSERPGLFGPVREALGATEAEVDRLEDLYDEPAATGRRARRRLRHEHHEILYRVSHDRWVLAGTYMATYTRLTTMEAANESARHAVNAILRALADATPSHDGGEPLYNAAGQDLGDPCTVQNPEDNEWPDLEPLRRLDTALVAEGLPHVLDILRVPELLALVPQRAAADVHPVRDLTRLLGLAGEAIGKDLPPLTAGVEALGAQLERQVRALYAKLGLAS